MIENVPRIKSRGKMLLHQVKTLLKSYKYEVHDSTHCCGELGGLGQRRSRYLLIARNPYKVPSFIYQPPKLKLKSIGEVLESLPMPDDTEKGGRMHRLQRLQWKTWVRLALIEPGKDWRSLQDALGHEPRAGAYRIVPWDQPSTTVTSATRGVGQSNGVSAVADPRLDKVQGYGNKYQVIKWDEPSPTVTGSRNGSGCPFIADPTMRLKDSTQSNIYKVQKWEEPASCVTGSIGVSNGATCISDPRLPKREKRYPGLYKVVAWDETSSTVLGQTDIQAGALSVADTRLNCKPRSGTMGVQRWDEAASTVIGSSDIHASASAVADPHIPNDNDRPKDIPIIISHWSGCWHRPLTTLELAALQGLPTTFPDGSPLELAGNSDAVWREHIGNMVPPPAAQAIAEAILKTLMPNFMGDWYWDTEGVGVWVKPVAKIDEVILNKQLYS